MGNPSLRITSLSMRDIGPFPYLLLEFQDKPGLNLVCGENGVGKTTVLEAITATFSLGNNHRIKRRQAGSSGMLEVSFRSKNGTNRKDFKISNFDPRSGDFVSSRNHDEAVNLIHIRTSRDIEYYEQNSISRDPTFDRDRFAQKLTNNLQAQEIKSWFTNRYLLSPHANNQSWTQQMVHNFEAAKDFFSILDSDISLEEVDVRTFEIMISTPNGSIPFELMSAGFRSTYYLLLSIIKEIEFRKLDTSAYDFSGTILVDEIDLHLHPTWQQEIGRILTTAFPNAQIIATTHSPHVIQTTDATDVISLQRGSDGQVERTKIPVGEYGFKGWTVEEVLEEVMGVENTRTSTFQNALMDFDKAIDNENSQEVNVALSKLRKMLHYRNPLRKLIEIQSAPFDVDDEIKD